MKSQSNSQETPEKLEKEIKDAMESDLAFWRKFEYRCNKSVLRYFWRLWYGESLFGEVKGGM